MANPQNVGTISPETTAAVERLKAAAGAAADRIRAQQDQIKAGMTPEEAAQVNGDLGQIADGLEKASADPNNPPAPPAVGVQSQPGGQTPRKP
jgi:hypothetical protein